MDQHEHAAPNAYGFYPDDDTFMNIYPNTGSYVVQPGPQAQHIAPPELQNAFQLRSGLGLMGGAPQPYDGHAMYANSPRGQHPSLNPDPSPPPASPGMYDPLSPPISGSDTSGDGAYHSRNSSTSSSRANSLVHRNPLRYNPTPSPSGSSGRRSRGRSFNDSDEDMGISLAESIATTRKEATRRQRIEAEQRRRDELRDGYARLKDVLPVSNQKSSKVSLLERATNHIVQLEKMNQQMQKRLAAIESEVQRLRSLNEKISLTGNTPSPGIMGIDSRPLSPPPEGTKTGHSLTPIMGDAPDEDSSPSPSDGGY
ncbi:hypothetical protein OF83DRAFT_1087820 [Amylostereum chailletii]|nr:hypothetical protein OF83DRAFT_1087820 [Amylostereum chailletii]